VVLHAGIRTRWAFSVNLTGTKPDLKIGEITPETSVIYALGVSSSESLNAGRVFARVTATSRPRLGNSLCFHKACTEPGPRTER